MTSSDCRLKGAAPFRDWCDQRGIGRPGEVTKGVLESYKRHVHLYRKKDGKPLAINSQRVVLEPVKTFFLWLFHNNHILQNPAVDLELPMRNKRLPRNVLSVEEVEAVLSQPDIEEPMGLRNRAMMEVLYSTGIRRAELTSLELYDIDAGRGVVFIRQGKGKKDRIIPIGTRALKWVDRYLREVRLKYALDDTDGPLFVSYRGGALNPDTLSRITKRYIDQANIDKTGACHIFRHSAATLMLEGGADVRYVQEMLGHEELSSTQIYTKVSIGKLKEVYEKSHPAGQAEKREGTSKNE